MPRAVRSQRQKVGWWVLRLWAWKEGKLVFNGDRVSIWEDETFLEMDAQGCGHTRCYPAAHLKMARMVSFML